jgi:hypothetical protein
MIINLRKPRIKCLELMNGRVVVVKKNYKPSIPETAFELRGFHPMAIAFGVFLVITTAMPNTEAAGLIDAVTKWSGEISIVKWLIGLMLGVAGIAVLSRLLALMMKIIKAPEAGEAIKNIGDIGIIVAVVVAIGQGFYEVGKIVGF